MKDGKRYPAQTFIYFNTVPSRMFLPCACKRNLKTQIIQFPKESLSKAIMTTTRSEDSVVFHFQKNGKLAQDWDPKN